VKLLAKILRHSVSGLVRVACALALLGLAVMSFSIISGRPLPVVLAMSVGHMVGTASLACFLMAILIDALHRSPTTSAEPAAERTDAARVE
jgi:hypothetical protein